MQHGNGSFTLGNGRSRLAMSALALAGLAGVALGATATATAAGATTARHRAGPGGRGRALRAGAVYGFGVVGNGFGPKLMMLDHAVPAPVAGIPGTVVEVATSNSDSYALTATGSVWAWGAGSTGELGDGLTTTYASAPVRVLFPAGVRIVALANPMPYDSALAIDANGNVWGWGLDVAHTLCLPGTDVLLPTRLPLTDVSLATGAGDHSLFDAGGHVYACGLGADGELGNGSTSGSAAPTEVTGLPAGRVRALVSSWQGSGALMASGSYFDWGFNRGGQLGDGQFANSDVPVQVSLPAPVQQVFQGGSNANNGQTLALLANGSLFAWGDGSFGQLGTGRTTGSARPLPVWFPPKVHIRQVSTGGDSSYAIDAAGILWTWGGNDFGQLGNGSTRYLTKPEPTGLQFRQISATATNVAGILSGSAAP